MSKIEKNVSRETTKEYLVIVESFFTVKANSLAEAEAIVDSRMSAAEIDSPAAEYSDSEYEVYEYEEGQND